MPPYQLQADYKSPTSEPHTFSDSLPTLSSTSPSTEERTAYLSSLLDSVHKVQGEINEFLTKRMEEDNKAAGKAGVDEKKEEENYGEEAVEED